MAGFCCCNTRDQNTHNTHTINRETICWQRRLSRRPQCWRCQWRQWEWRRGVCRRVFGFTEKTHRQSFFFFCFYMRALFIRRQHAFLYYSFFFSLSLSLLDVHFFFTQRSKQVVKPERKEKAAFSAKNEESPFVHCPYFPEVILFVQSY